MFSQFQGFENRPPQLPPSKIERPVRHPGATAHACTECRRRKSRCDGRKPCLRCRDSNKPELCQYVVHKPRVIPSQKKLDELSNNLQQHRIVLEQLFPSTSIEELVTKDRNALFQLIQEERSPKLDDLRSVTASSSTAPRTEDASVLEQLQSDPAEYNEESPDFVADDVNALSLSDNRQTSYIGSSSISAALKVISFLCPGILGYSALAVARSPSNRSDLLATQHAVAQIPYEREMEFIDAYFEHVHVLIPMVNEPQLRHIFDSTAERDSAQAGLLNMVLALGSIARENHLDTTHFVYYQRARNALSFDSFGSGKIEIVQALGLMGGYYLHYCNRPNMAVAIMGVALRMAYALGLHKLSTQPHDSVMNFDATYVMDQEVKRRTWWALVCLDVWGSTTLGRPGIGYCFGAAVSTPRPTFQGAPTGPNGSDYPFMVASVQFCEISALMQDRLAASPCLTLSEISGFSMQLENIFAMFPDYLKDHNPCNSHLIVPRAILKWRYQNARLLLYRPVLLAAALARKTFSQLSQEEEEAVNSCRDIARDSIEDIACDWVPNAICSWNAIWFLFQASMVPLVSLFWEYQDSRKCEKWNNQIDFAVRALKTMELWSPAGERTRHVIKELQEVSQSMALGKMIGASMTNSQQQIDFLNAPWDESGWEEWGHLQQYPYQMSHGA